MVQSSFQNALAQNALKRIFSPRQQTSSPFVQPGTVFPAQQPMQNPMQNLSRAQKFDLLTQSLAGLGAGFAAQGRPVVGARGINMLPGRGAAIQGMMSARQNYMDNLRKQQVAQAQTANLQSQMQGRQIKAAGDQLSLGLQRRLDEGIRRDPNFMNTPEGKALVGQMNVARTGNRPATLQIADALMASAPPGTMTPHQAIRLASRGGNTVDLGDRIIITEADGRQRVVMKNLAPAQQPQNIQTREIAKVKGKDTGQRQVQAPDIIANTTGALNLIDSMFDHPGKNVIGSRVRQMINDPEGGMFVNPNPTDEKDFMIMHNFVMSQNFVNAVQQMRGLGQLSDREGAALAKSRNALSIASKPETYFKNLREIQQTLKTARQRARDALNRAKPPGEAQLLSGKPKGNDSNLVDAALDQYGRKY
jgi:hypothetical protein